jgi:hypothetical protein
MKANEIKYGGPLEIGDFIFVGCSWQFMYGWFCGNGKSDTIQYITPSSVYFAHKQDESVPFPSIRKSYVRQTKIDTIIKISDPDKIFSQHELKFYLEAKEILNKIKFLKS